mmetsp:Transcript_53171/g.142175  ORF Transcript_53171/g.142175 Transcript_53171/m.142175 type:complete len:233 (+) Transcript_53171:155-853(+)
MAVARRRLPMRTWKRGGRPCARRRSRNSWNNRDMRRKKLLRRQKPNNSERMSGRPRRRQSDAERRSLSGCLWRFLCLPREQGCQPLLRRAPCLPTFRVCCRQVCGWTRLTCTRPRTANAGSRRLASSALRVTSLMGSVSCEDDLQEGALQAPCRSLLRARSSLRLGRPSWPVLVSRVCLECQEFQGRQGLHCKCRRGFYLRCSARRHPSVRPWTGNSPRHRTCSILSTPRLL